MPTQHAQHISQWAWLLFGIHGLGRPTVALLRGKVVKDLLHFANARIRNLIVPQPVQVAHVKTQGIRHFLQVGRLKPFPCLV